MRCSRRCRAASTCARCSAARAACGRRRRPAALLLDTSTVDVETSRFCHEASAERGFRFVDSPVSGGIAGATAGTLTFMLGGEEDAVAEAASLVEPMAGHVFMVGGPTMGIAAKLANNLMLFVSLLGLAEGSQLAAELGLDAETFFKVASVSSGDSWPLRTWYPVPGVVATSPANRNFDATFTTVLAEKDLSFALAAGEQAGLHLPAARHRARPVRAAHRRGLRRQGLQPHREVRVGRRPRRGLRPRCVTTVIRPPPARRMPPRPPPHRRRVWWWVGGGVRRGRRGDRRPGVPAVAALHRRAGRRRDPGRVCGADGNAGARADRRVLVAAVGTRHARCRRRRPRAPSTSSHGTLISHEHETSGTVRVIQLPDGSRQLAIENLETTNGPDVHVWLSAGPVVEGFDGWFTAGGHPYVDLGHDQGQPGQPALRHPGRRRPRGVPDASTSGACSSACRSAPRRSPPS